MKTCSKCKKTKDESEYYPRRDRGPNSVRPVCKDCTKAQLAALPKPKYSELNPEQKLKQKIRTRKFLLKKLYSMSPEDYNEMLERQGGKCAICGSEKVGGRHTGNTFMIDHDHKTGKVRALLCNPCNRLIGAMERDLSVAQAALNYLTTPP